MKHIVTALCLIALLSPTAVASDSNGNSDFMPLEQVRPGMKGYGMSVFRARNRSDSRSRCLARWKESQIQGKPL